MKGVRTHLLMFAFLLARSALADPAYVEGEVLVRYKHQLGAGALKRAARKKGMIVRRRFRGLSKRRKRTYCHLKSKNRTTEQLIADLRQDPNVDYVCPNYLIPVCGPQLPNDAHFFFQWGLHNIGQEVQGITGTADADIDAPEAWSLCRRDTPEVVVAVIDTGIDYTHPDLAGAMWVNPGEIPNNFIDDDGNGYVDDVYGYDFSGDSGVGARDSDPQDAGYHGTHVAGILAAIGNNSTGVTGTAKIKIMALKASTNGFSMVSASCVEAIDYATMMKTSGVAVVAINMSYGWYFYNGLEKAAIDDAGVAGIVAVASAGNDFNNNDLYGHYPSGYAQFGAVNLLAVASSGRNDGLATFSNYGMNWVDLAAPGISILSTIPGHYSTIASVQSPPDDYGAVGFRFAGTTEGITKTAHDCGIGQPAQFPGEVTGNIAVIQRGTLSFGQKTANAKDAGAVGVIIYNNEAGAPVVGTLGAPGSWLPAVSISQSDGAALLEKGTPTVTLINSPVHYEFTQGTSQSAPYVSGAVALMAQHYPDDTAAQRRVRVRTSVDVIPGLATFVATSGRLNLRRAMDTDGDNLGDWWEIEHFTNILAVTGATDFDGDGFDEESEFIAGTDPKAATSLLEVTTVSAGVTNGFELKWRSESNRLYSVYSTTNVTDGFTALTSDIAATPPENTLVDTSAVGRARSFYRVTTSPPYGPQ